MRTLHQTCSHEAFHASPGIRSRTVASVLLRAAPEAWLWGVICWSILVASLARARGAELADFNSEQQCSTLIDDASNMLRLCPNTGAHAPQSKPCVWHGGCAMHTCMRLRIVELKRTWGTFNRGSVAINMLYFTAFLGPCIPPALGASCPVGQQEESRSLPFDP